MLADFRDRPETCIRATLDHLALSSPDARSLGAFYERALGYRIEPMGDGYFAASGPARRLLLAPGEPRRLAYAGFVLDDPNELERLRVRAATADIAADPIDIPFFAKGAIAITCPDGNRFVFGLRESAPVGGTEAGALPTARLQHLVMASRDAKMVSKFFSEALGFTLSDTVVDAQGDVRTAFLRSSHEHHSFGVFLAPENGFDHHCYETTDWNAIKDWCDHMARQDIPIKWGPGRHGPGNNVFFFVIDPDGNWVELSAELETMPHERPAGVWPQERRTINSWGEAKFRS